MPRCELLTNLPPRPRERGRIFRLAAPTVDERAAVSLAQRFGLSGDLRAGRVDQNPRQLIYAERSFELSLHRASGGLRFHDTARWQVDDGTSNATIEDGAAVRIAQRYIERFAVAPLDQCRLLRVSRLRVGVVERLTGLAEERVIDLGIGFHRAIDDVPVLGPGGKVIVFVDHNGELTGIDRLWREIREVHRDDVELQPPEFAQREVVRALGDQGAGLIKIEDVRFGYVERDWDEAQSFLQPAYVVPFTILATEGPFEGRPMMRSEHIVAAAIDSPEPILLPPPVVPRQKQRYADV